MSPDNITPKQQELLAARRNVIAKYLNDINGYIKNVIPEDPKNYDQRMTLYEDERKHLQVEMVFYTINDEEVFTIQGRRLKHSGMYNYKDDRYYDVNILFDHRLVNLLLFIHLRDTVHVNNFNFEKVLNTYRLDKANFGKFYSEVLVYFM